MDSYLPILKPANWEGKYSKLCRRFYAGDIAEDKNPLVAYGLDHGEMIEFLSKELSDEPSTTIHEKSLANLKQILSDSSGWTVADIDTIVPGALVLSFTGYFYSSEAVLSSEILQHAHIKLKARSLIVSFPMRGVLYALSSNVDKKTLQEFSIASIAKYYQSGDAQISAMIWNVENGAIVGYLAGTEDIEDYIKSQTLKKQQEELSGTEIREVISDDVDGKTIHLIFYNDNPELLLKSIEQTIRKVAQEYRGKKLYSGRITVAISMTPNLVINHDNLVDELDGMIPFISEQLEAMQLGPDNHKFFRVSYELIEIG